jgi:hypothetical protein
MRRALLALFFVFAVAAPLAAAEPKVTVTLVRWPYT